MHYDDIDAHISRFFREKEERLNALIEAAQRNYDAINQRYQYVLEKSERKRSVEQLRRELKLAKQELDDLLNQKGT